MSAAIQVSRRAAREIEDHFDFLARRSRPAAERWRVGLLAAVASLADQPERCPPAQEAEW